MATPNTYPCALCDRSFADAQAFRRHLEDAHGFFDPLSEPPAFTPPVSPTTPGNPLGFDWDTPAQAPEVEPRHDVWQEQPQFSAGRSTEAVLAVGLFLAFFLPWFRLAGFGASSGIGMLSWLPSRVHGVEVIVPYLAALIPLAALAVVFQWWRGGPVQTVATVTGALAPAFVAYAVLRGEGSTLLKVLNVGAYLTLILSVVLLAVARDWWQLPRLSVNEPPSRRDLRTAGIALALVLAAVTVPQLTEQRSRSEVLAAFSLTDRSPTRQSLASGTQLNANRKTPVVTSPTTSPSASPTTPSTDAASPPTDAATPGTAAPAGVTHAGTGVATTGRSTSPTSAKAPTPTTAPKPHTAAPPASACPGGRAVAQVTHFGPVTYDSASDLYYADITGTVCNGTADTIDLYSADVAVYDGSGDNVDSGSADLSGSLEPGQSRSWSIQHESVDSPNGPPTRAVVTKLRYS